MKPQYIFFLLFAVFITGLSDGISFALLALPGIGIVLDFVIEVSINATMGAGLLMLLILNGMYHPKLSPFGIVGGLLPGLNVLPFWVGLVIVGIVHKTAEEGGALAPVAKLAENLKGVYGSSENPFTQIKAATGAVLDARERKPAGINSDITPHEQMA